MRVYGLRALGAASAADSASVAVLRTHIRRSVRDPDPRVQAEALGIIAAADTGDTRHTLDALYLESLASADPIVRATAISALGRHHDAVYLSALLDAYARAQSDRENDAVLAAVAALGSMARSDSAIARTFFVRFQRSPDPLVRRAVQRAFGAGSWGAVLPATDRPLTYYQDVVERLLVPALRDSVRPRVAIHSAAGDVVIELRPDQAPLTVDNFMTLIASGYFNAQDTRWHRVVPNFVLQDGDPRGDGNGSPGYSIRDEINPLRYTRGAVGMALSGRDTGGSQFFITHSPQPHLDGGYTVFGYVVAGMDAADRTLQDDAIRGIEIIR
jgi:cyclophilin family peptidyl-prolyl cis-trans isomerase